MVRLREITSIDCILHQGWGGNTGSALVAQTSSQLAYMVYVSNLRIASQKIMLHVQHHYNVRLH